MSVAPPIERAGPPAVARRSRARYVIERNLLVYRHAWMILLSGFFEPVFYLFAIGVGIGQLIGDVTGPGGAAVSYTAYVAPGLLAASAMNGAVYESTFNIFFKMKFGKVYDGMLATPVAPRDIAVGEITWCQVRGFLYAAAFLGVMALMGLLASPLSILALPGAVLIGFAFGAVGMAATSYMRSWTDFDMVQLVIMPLFLFSATFFPLEVYPPLVRPLVQLSPLYHGTAMLRALTLGTADWTVLGHAAFLVVMTAVGMIVATRRLKKLLLN